MKPRTLKHGEKALWEKVVRTVAPLHASETSVPTPATPPAPAGASLPATVQPPGKDAAAASRVGASGHDAGVKAGTAVPFAAQSAKPRAAGDLDRKMRRKLARGAVTIDGRIDLHGMTQEQAHLALLRFVDVSVGERRRVVLVITGKGISSDGRGVLRRSVPHWLTGRELARFVVSFGPAHQSHGGDGAIYVRLRSGR